MPSPDLPLRIRIARPSDYKAIARLCRLAVGPGDYVLEILRETIANRGLFLAWDKDELAGITHFERCIDGSGWLSMARTDPDWRRHGVALALQHHIAGYGRRKGVTFLRLWVLAGNRPSILASRKAGFRPICEAAHVSASLRVTRKLERVPPLNSMHNNLLGSLLRSPYLARMNGYFAYRWHFVKASKHLLNILLRNRELYYDCETAFILTRPEMSFGKPYGSFTPLIGTFAQSLQKIKQVAKALGPVSLGSYIPYDAHLLRLAQENGYRHDLWAKHCTVFEKNIYPSQPSHARKAQNKPVCNTHDY